MTTLEATIRWSYELLTPAARDTLLSAAVFVGGFALESLEAVTGGAADAELGELLQASLVQGQAGDGRSGLFELVRAFGLQELDAGQRLQETQTRHLRYFAALAQSASEAYEAGVAFCQGVMDRSDGFAYVMDWPMQHRPASPLTPFLRLHARTASSRVRAVSTSVTGCRALA